ncbi:SMC (chromosome segregation protein) domain-containing protein [Histoplasma capsulatum]|uniref:SMC (Chromosome segregation protein) domain-containing protein n=1 Tax=Ajellomyces capsulatus TaxID=5037 RepID=A0A8A1MLP8_AJECA|nr:predicted protein [Histoplasma mississippiense (nom. inval.)]EDN11334.1 predicted protein [Histoplasma mississippiense (nom. inval.)]QSS66759.1 SMC (chromosome segregation protein) domain-containing protein [Histoplasma capsulatum]
MASKNKNTARKRSCGAYSPATVESSTKQIGNATGSINSSLPSLAEPRTPSRKTKVAKRVRFSDPGPPVESLSSYLDKDLSTGLTPAIKRTRIDSEDSPSSKETNAKRARRRRSEPTPRTDSDGVKYECPELPSETQTFQFLSCSAILDPRARRRIARFGLSEEMNCIIERKREKEKEEKAKEEELMNLRRELSALRDVKTEAQDDRIPRTPERIKELSMARQRIEELEALLRTYEGSSHAETEWMSQTANEDHEMIFIGDDITIMDNEMLTTSSSPIPSRVSSSHLLTSDASTQVALQDQEQQAENNSLNAQLRNMRQEKRALFKEWRAIVGSNEVGTRDRNPIDSSLYSPASPPPNFLSQIATTLRKAVSRESRALKTLETVAKDLSGHGFNGTSASEILSDMGARFRQARLELERAVPVRDLASTREQVSGCENREVALRNQFNMTLHRLEQTGKKNKSLEEASDSMAADLMHVRMKTQKLEQDIEILETDKTRLNNAIERYRVDLKILEELNMKLEDDTLSSMEKASSLRRANSALDGQNELYKQRIIDLEQSELDQRAIREEMQRLLDQRTTELTALESKIEQLKSEHHEAIVSQSCSHEKQMGAINVRVSLLTNALNEAQSEIQTLRADKARLQSRLNSLQQLFSRETIHAARERAAATAQELMEWERKMSALYGGGIGSPQSLQVRQNDNSGDNEHCSTPKGDTAGFAPVGSEPITPSCDRFVNVEIQRGKKRKRRPDSAIEIVEEEEEGEDGFEDSGIADKS